MHFMNSGRDSSLYLTQGSSPDYLIMLLPPIVTVSAMVCPLLEAQTVYNLLTSAADAH
jgi:hypothetical protein